MEGAADVPSTIAETGNRLLPQLWNKQKHGNLALLNLRASAGNVPIH